MKIRKSMLVNYLEGELRRKACPFCGLSNCTIHQKLSGFTQFDELNELEQNEVMRILKLVKDEKWGIRIDEHDDIFIVNENNELEKVEIFTEVATGCSNPDCKCNGNCGDKCKCKSLAEKTFPQYNFGGTLWDKIKNSKWEEQVIGVVKAFEKEIPDGSTITFGELKQGPMLCPTAMLFCESLECPINTGIPLEALYSDRY